MGEMPSPRPRTRPRPKSFRDVRQLAKRALYTPRTVYYGVRISETMCWHCGPAFVDNGCHTWDNIRYHACMPDKDVCVCPSCWEACPYRGALTMVNTRKGELTLYEGGGLTLATE